MGWFNHQLVQVKPGSLVCCCWELEDLWSRFPRDLDSLFGKGYDITSNIPYTIYSMCLTTFSERRYFWSVIANEGGWGLKIEGDNLFLRNDFGMMHIIISWWLSWLIHLSLIEIDSSWWIDWLTDRLIDRLISGRCFPTTNFCEDFLCWLGFQKGGWFHHQPDREGQMQSNDLKLGTSHASFRTSRCVFFFCGRWPGGPEAIRSFKKIGQKAISLKKMHEINEISRNVRHFFKFCCWIGFDSFVWGEASMVGQWVVTNHCCVGWKYLGLHFLRCLVWRFHVKGAAKDRYCQFLHSCFFNQTRKTIKINYFNFHIYFAIVNGMGKNHAYAICMLFLMHFGWMVDFEMAQPCVFSSFSLVRHTQVISGWWHAVLGEVSSPKVNPTKLVKDDLGGGFYCWFSPRTLGKWSNLTTLIFDSNGLVQPPTSDELNSVCWRFNGSIISMRFSNLIGALFLKPNHASQPWCIDIHASYGCTRWVKPFDTW